MADYCGATRSNYFKVTDEDALSELLSSSRCEDKKIVLFEREVDGEKTFSFGCSGGIEGVDDNDDDLDVFEDRFNVFVSRLQAIIPAGEVITIIEAGYNGIQDVGGSAVVVTKDACSYIGLRDKAERAAQEMLGNPKYNLVME